MCTNFKSVNKEDVMARFGQSPDVPWAEDVYIGYTAPFVRLKHNNATETDLQVGGFGLVPFWAKEKSIERYTYNARTETVSEKPSFREAWKSRQLCVVPMQSFYEPYYAPGETKSVRWRIGQKNNAMFFAAGLWSKWNYSEGEHYSFTLLTVNADGHAVMGRFHKPGDERRSLVIVRDDEVQQWLNADASSSMRFFNTSRIDEFICEPSPREPRARRPTGSH